MNSRTTRSFRRDFARLPEEVQERAREAFATFSRDPTYPSLQFKKVHSREPIYSARITRDYRAVCVVRDDQAVWYFIGSHADYDRLLSKL